MEEICPCENLEKKLFKLRKMEPRKRKKRKGEREIAKTSFYEIWTSAVRETEGELVGYVVRVETECPKALLACLSKIIA